MQYLADGGGRLGTKCTTVISNWCSHFRWLHLINVLWNRLSTSSRSSDLHCSKFRPAMAVNIFRQLRWNVRSLCYFNQKDFCTQHLRWCPPVLEMEGSKATNVPFQVQTVLLTSQTLTINLRHSVSDSYSDHSCRSPSQKSALFVSPIEINILQHTGYVV